MHQAFRSPAKPPRRPLCSFVQEAWIGGVSTRRVDALARARGAGGASKSTVPKPRGYIAERESAFLDRPLTGDRPLAPVGRHIPRNPPGGRIVSDAAIRKGFGRPGRAVAGEMWRKVADRLRPRWPKLVEAGGTDERRT